MTQQNAAFFMERLPSIIVVNRPSNSVIALNELGENIDLLSLLKRSSSLLGFIF